MGSSVAKPPRHLVGPDGFVDRALSGGNGVAPTVRKPLDGLTKSLLVMLAFPDLPIEKRLVVGRLTAAIRRRNRQIFLPEIVLAGSAPHGVGRDSRCPGGSHRDSTRSRPSQLLFNVDGGLANL